MKQTARKMKNEKCKKKKHGKRAKGILYA